jgi:glucokinase
MTHRFGHPANMFLGIEIGGTKLQLGVGPGDGTILALERLRVDASGGAEPIRAQILQAIPHLLSRAKLSRGDIQSVGIGFGGPVDAERGMVVKSHQVNGWTGFPLATWSCRELGWPTVVHNDADTAGLAEACFGAGRSLSPIFYITIGSGIGGGLIIDQKIYRGGGAGAAEIGHMVVPRSLPDTFQGHDELAREYTVESIASGWGIEQRLSRHLVEGLPCELCCDASPEISQRLRADAMRLMSVAGGNSARMSVELIAREAQAGNELAKRHLSGAIRVLGWGIAQLIALVNPRRIVIGGGVASLGDRLFDPLRREVSRQVFDPFREAFDIQPAELGEAVVVHGALRLAASA